MSDPFERLDNFFHTSKFYMRICFFSNLEWRASYPLSTPQGVKPDSLKGLPSFCVWKLGFEVEHQIQWLSGTQGTTQDRLSEPFAVTNYYVPIETMETKYLVSLTTWLKRPSSLRKMRKIAMCKEPHKSTKHDITVVSCYLAHCLSLEANRFLQSVYII